MRIGILDIEMVGDDGLQVAREVRKTDSSVAIIFSVLPLKQLAQLFHSLVDRRSHTR